MARDPLLDIVILIHDHADWADLCVRSVEHFTKNPYRLILVDMASQEQVTKDWLDDCEDRGHTVVRLPDNRSFSHGVNAGVEVGSAKFICVLNDDAIVTEGWDGALLTDASEKGVGLVGARSNFASGAQMDPTFQGEPPFLVFVCVALRRDVYKAVGPLDEETFDGFSCEDLDYSWRVKKAGLRLKLSSAFVFHAGSRTLMSSVGDDEARARNNQKYQARLIDKHGKDYVAGKTKLKQRGLVVSYHPNEWTRVEFLKNLMFLRRSDGVSFEYLQVSRAPIHMARQKAADFALDGGFDWFVQLDDDATFPSDVLRQLLAHQKDVVTALAYQRKPPHLPCVFELGEDDTGKRTNLGAPMEGIEHTGLRRVDVSGFHCSIMRTSVIKKMRAGIIDEKGAIVVPGTRQYYGGFDNQMGEDFAFSLNLKKYGIELYCDTNLISGHIGAEVVVDEEYRKRWKAGAIQIPDRVYR